MTVPEILKELELCPGKFPRAATESAVEQREAITPELLRVVEPSPPIPPPSQLAPTIWSTSLQDYL